MGKEHSRNQEKKKVKSITNYLWNTYFYKRYLKISQTRRLVKG